MTADWLYNWKYPDRGGPCEWRIYSIRETHVATN